MKLRADLSPTQGGGDRVAAVAYQVILEPGIGQLREFESPRVLLTRINSSRLFIVHRLTCGKCESMS